MVTLSIGRQSGCNIVVDDPTVSRRHADLSRLGEDLFLLVDRGSTSGSYRLVDGKWTQFTNARFRGGDRVMLGGFETTIRALIDRGSQPKLESQAKAQPERRGSSYVERDPATGQLLIRTR